MNKPMTQLPGFDESLRLLVMRERYSFTDIAAMFDVSREWIRACCEFRGIEHPEPPRFARGIYAVRRWHDELNRFVPVRRSTAKEGAARRRVERSQKRMTRQAGMITIVERLPATLGHEPSWIEIADACGIVAPRQSGNAQVLRAYFGTATIREIGLSRATALSRKQCGIEGRRPGQRNAIVSRSAP